MKKILLIITGFVTVIALSFCFSACGSSSATIEDIAGVWVANSYSVEDNEETEMGEKMANKTFISIEKNGSALLATYGYKFNGTITDNGDNTFTFKHDSSSLEDVTYTFEDERLSSDRSEEMGYPYIEYYAITTMNALKASLIDTDDSNDSGNNDLSGTMSNIQCQIISLDIPILWTEKYDFDCNIKEDKSGSVTLYQKASRQAGVGGVLVSIVILEPSTDYNVFADYKYLGILKQNGFDYSVVAVYPTDVEYNSATEAEYKTMQKDVDAIVNSVEGINGAQFIKK